LLRQIAFDEPVRPREVNPRVPVDLETIVGKAIEKEAADRYRSAQELADDLRRFARHEPIKARRARPLERLAKWSRRHVGVVWTILAAALLGIGLLAVSTALILQSQSRMRAALDQAASHQQRLGESLYAADIRLAAQAWKENDPRRAVELLARHLPKSGRKDDRGLEWHYLWGRCRGARAGVLSTDGALYDVDFSPDGRLIAAAGQDAVLRVYEWPSMQLAARIETGQTEVNGLAFSSDGRTIATVGDNGELRLWYDLRPASVRTVKAHNGIAYNVVYSNPLKCWITCGDDAMIRLFSAEAARPIGDLKGHAEPVSTIALSHSGTIVASASRDSTVRVWDLREMREIRAVNCPERMIALAFDDQDRVLLAGGVMDYGGQITMIHMNEPRETSVPVSAHRIDSLALSPNRRLLAAALDGGVVWTWRLDPETLQPNSEIDSTWHAHNGRIYEMVFAPDGRRLVTAGEDGKLTTWKHSVQAREHNSYKVLGEVQAIAPMGSKPLVAVAGVNGVGVVDIRTGAVVTQVAQGPYRHIDATPDGQRIAASNWDGEVFLWSVNDSGGRLEKTIQFDQATARLKFSPDNAVLAVWGPEAAPYPIRLFDVDADTQRAGLLDHGCRGALWSPDGRLFVAAENQTDDVLVRDAKTGELLRRLDRHRTTVTALAVSPDSRLLASVDDSRFLILWDLQRGESVWSGTSWSNVHSRGWPTSLQFSPEGGTLFLLNSHGALTAWHVATGREMCHITDGSAFGSCLTVCCDGRYLCMAKGSRLHVIDTGFSPGR
jgi:WD40 repeat protein